MCGSHFLSKRNRIRCVDYFRSVSRCPFHKIKWPISLIFYAVSIAFSDLFYYPNNATAKIRKYFHPRSLSTAFNTFWKKPVLITNNFFNPLKKCNKFSLWIKFKVALYNKLRDASNTTVTAWGKKLHYPNAYIRDAMLKSSIWMNLTLKWRGKISQWSSERKLRAFSPTVFKLRNSDENHNLCTKRFERSEKL